MKHKGKEANGDQLYSIGHVLYTTDLISEQSCKVGVSGMLHVDYFKEFTSVFSARHTLKAEEVTE